MCQTKFTRFHGLLFLLSFFACMDRIPLRAVAVSQGIDF